MNTRVPDGFRDTVRRMRADHGRILRALDDYGLVFDDYPALEGSGCPKGIGAARAYPIQGVLKYHGLADWHWRTAYLPSISVTSDAAYTVTLVEFAPAFGGDAIIINGRAAGGRERERVVRTLDAVRGIAGIQSRARVVSKNVVRGARTGKGLGTSAAASAALAAAAVAALFGAQAAGNARFLSCMARLLAGSGSRSAVGGASLWLSYPGIPHEESFAVRFDQGNQLRDMRLITVPLESRIGLKTERAHRDAPRSSLFKAWMYARCDEVLECLAAVQEGNWRVLGQMAEVDSIRLHAITMSGSRENKIIAWEPENIALFRLCNELRGEGIPVYFSTDTGPTTVFLTYKDHEDAVVSRVEGLDMGLELIRGGMAGPAQLLDGSEASEELGV